MSDDPASIEAWQQQMSDVIVRRLRACSSGVEPESRIHAWYWLPKTANEAADEIERLRGEIDKKSLVIKAMTEALDEAVRAANKLTAERDEARRRICSGCSEIMGLNCFKENTNG